MNSQVLIEDILQYLDEENIKYTFIGNEKDVINGFSTLFNYKEETITFISTLYKFKNYVNDFKDKKIKLIITDPSEEKYYNFENVIQITKPTNAFFSILERFFDNTKSQQPIITSNENTFTEKSYISPHAELGENVKIGIGCIIEPNVKIGDNTVIHHNVVIKNGTVIGDQCQLNSGTIIGESGFNPYTLEDKSKKMIKHFGGVHIGNNVNIGVNCSIHKGTIDDTIIKDGVKINAMVHIAHNCIVGKNTVVTMPTQICGSVVVGENCHIAATTIRNQCTIGDNAVLGLGSVVVKDVPENTTVVGNPAKPLKK